MHLTAETMEEKKLKQAHERKDLKKTQQGHEDSKQRKKQQLKARGERK